jgi:cysteine synthase A
MGRQFGRAIEAFRAANPRSCTGSSPTSPPRRLRALRGDGGFLPRGRHRAEAIQTEHQDRRRRAGRSSVLLGGPAGLHKIEGVGIGYTPPLWDPTLVDEILPVKTEDAKAMARRLAREEALFAGTLSGANIVAAIRVAE